MNKPEDIADAFQPFYEGRIVNETDPDRLYPIKRDVESTGLLDEDEMQTITDFWFGADRTDPKAMRTIMGQLSGLKARFDAADEETQRTFRDRADEFVRVYGFLSHIMTWVNEELERLYVYLQAALKVTTPESEPGVDLSNELVIRRLAHRVQETVSIGLTADDVEAGETFGERTDRPAGERLINLEEVRSIIERINEKHATDFTDIEVLESGKAVTLISTSEGLAELIADNDIEDIVDTEWKRLLLLVLPQLEDHGNEFWAAIRENPQMLEDLGRSLVREACESLAS